jgi:hypothetical protein
MVERRNIRAVYALRRDNLRHLRRGKFVAHRDNDIAGAVHDRDGRAVALGAAFGERRFGGSLGHGERDVVDDDRTVRRVQRSCYDGRRDQAEAASDVTHVPSLLA